MRYTVGGSWVVVAGEGVASWHGQFLHAVVGLNIRNTVAPFFIFVVGWNGVVQSVE